MHEGKIKKGGFLEIKGEGLFLCHKIRLSGSYSTMSLEQKEPKPGIHTQ